MLQQSARAIREPCFEPPPRVAMPRERRLTALAAAARAGGGAMRAYRDNAITLTVAADGGVSVAARGAAVAAAFGLEPGLLTGPPESLAGVLLTALAHGCANDAVTSFEAAVATPAAACVLLRGVVLPTAGGGDAILSWKQVLDDDATARLRAELLREMCVPAGRKSLARVFD